MVDTAAGKPSLGCCALGSLTAVPIQPIPPEGLGAIPRVLALSESGPLPPLDPSLVGHQLSASPLLSLSMLNMHPCLLWQFSAVAIVSISVFLPGCPKDFFFSFSLKANDLIRTRSSSGFPWAGFRKGGLQLFNRKSQLLERAAGP